MVKEPVETICWIVNDGDIDPEWIESLNSVLDDNHLLTLPNGERISFGDNVNFIFETNDLKYASPATVTRLGMIFLSEEDVDVNRITKTWLRKQDPKLALKLGGWIDEFFFPCLSWALEHNTQMITETTKVGCTNNGLAYVSGAQDKGSFVFGLMQGLGGNFNYKVRADFYKYVCNLTGERPVSQDTLMNYYNPKKGAWDQFV